MLNLNNIVDELAQKEAIESVLSSGNKAEETKVFYREVLNSVQEKETELNKYYYQFNYNEILQMVKDWKITTIHSIKTINTILNNYLEYYVGKGKIKQRHALFIQLDSLQDCLIEDVESMYFTSEQEYKMFVNNFCYNSQDSVIFSLLLEGIRGLEHQEIRNLKEEDVDFLNNTLTLRQHDKDGYQHTRTIKGSSILMENIHDAIYDDTYFKGNGLASIDVAVETLHIARNGFVVRNVGRLDYEPIGLHIIVQRVKRLSKAYNKSKLNPKNIFQSGMILKLKRIEFENGELTNDDFKNIHKMYNLSSNTWYSTKKLYLSVKDKFSVTE